MARQSFPAAGLPVLITRPEPQASRTATDLAQAFGARLRPVLSPLMAPEALTPALPPGPFAALILTSEAGADAAGRYSGLPPLAFCVGKRTAAAARQHGIAPLLVAADAGALVAGLAERPDPGPLLWLHGEDRATDLATRLSRLRISGLAVYAQRARPLSETARALLAEPGPVILPLYSPRSARLFLSAAPGVCAATLWPVAISAEVAAVLPPELLSQARVSETPDGQGMLSAIGCVLSPRLP